MPTILLTAFEPFAGADMNPSARVAEALTGATLPDGVRLVVTALPVVAAELPSHLDGLFRQHQPDAVLGLGEARGAERIRVEQRAVNRLVFQTDNSGAGATDQPVFAGGPPEYGSTVPAGEIAAAIASRGVGCELSLSAGTYCCNQLLYHALHHAWVYRPAILAGFVHLPSLPEQRVAGRCVTAAMPLALQVTAVLAALEVIARRLAAGNVTAHPSA